MLKILHVKTFRCLILHIPEAISMGDKIVVLSHRPATVKSIHEIKFEGIERNPINCRNCPEFSTYFNTLWKELDVNG